MIFIVDGQDITELVQSVAWSGGSYQAARKLTFSLIYNPLDFTLPTAAVEVGSTVIFSPNDDYDENSQTSFLGVIWDIDKSTNENIASFTAFDLLIYATKSKINSPLSGTAESIAKTVCESLGIPFGTAAATGIPVYYLCKQKSGYEAIMAAYTQASHQNSKKYMIVMRGNKLQVIEKGELISDVILDGESCITAATYKTSLDKMVNNVLMISTDGGTVDAVEDPELRQRFGTITDTYQMQDGQDNITAAGKLINGISQTITLTCIDNPLCVTGYSVIVKEKATGVYGRFYIESDSHSYDFASPQMSLTLVFENIMDEFNME